MAEMDWNAEDSVLSQSLSLHSCTGVASMKMKMKKRQVRKSRNYGRI